MTAWIAACQGQRLATWEIAGDGSAGSRRDLAGPAELDTALPVVLAGRTGRETPVPAAPMSGTLADHGRANLVLVPGLTDRASGAVTGGAETVLAGYLGALPEFDGICVVCDGDRTVWAHVSAREVVSFHTAHSPRLWQALGVTADAAPNDSFDAAIGEILTRPERLALRLTPASAAAPGHLIGAELAASRAYWLGRAVTVIAPPPERALYGRALALQGVPAETTDWETALLAGLAMVWRTVTTQPED